MQNEGAVSDTTIQIKELTVAEIREALDEASKATSDVVDMMLFDEFSIPDLMRMAEISREEIEAMKPSALWLLVNRCRDKNILFCDLRRKVLRYADLLATTTDGVVPQKPMVKA